MSTMKEIREELAKEISQAEFDGQQDIMLSVGTAREILTKLQSEGSLDAVDEAVQALEAKRGTGPAMDFVKRILDDLGGVPAHER